MHRQSVGKSCMITAQILWDQQQVSRPRFVDRIDDEVVAYSIALMYVGMWICFVELASSSSCGERSQDMIASDLNGCLVSSGRLGERGLR